MLVLTSVFKSKLYPLLPSDTWLTKANLSALFKRTINVLSDVAPNSPILRMDLEILRNVQKQEGLLL
jgi:chromosome segregation and condensation protein ScpB